MKTISGYLKITVLRCEVTVVK